MNKNIVIGIIVILILGVGGYAVYKNDERAPDVVIVNPGTTEKMKEYKSDKFGFSFSYPETYILTEKEVGDSNRKYTALVLIHKSDAEPRVNGEGPTAITYEIYTNVLDQNVKEWLIFSNQSNYNLKKAPYVETAIGGLSAIDYKWSGLYEGETTAFNFEDFIIAFSVTYFEESDQIVKDYAKIKETLTFQKRDFSNEETSNYLKANISALSPEKEVLGGKFYVTDFEFTGRSTGRVFYEDGHNAYVSKFTLSRGSDNKIKAVLTLEQ